MVLVIFIALKMIPVVTPCLEYNSTEVIFSMRVGSRLMLSQLILLRGPLPPAGLNVITSSRVEPLSET
jgi:hypothetical protein